MAYRVQDWHCTEICRHFQARWPCRADAIAVTDIPQSRRSELAPTANFGTLDYCDRATTGTKI